MTLLLSTTVVFFLIIVVSFYLSTCFDFSYQRHYATFSEEVLLNSNYYNFLLFSVHVCFIFIPSVFEKNAPTSSFFVNCALFLYCFSFLFFGIVLLLFLYVFACSSVYVLIQCGLVFFCCCCYCLVSYLAF